MAPSAGELVPEELVAEITRGNLEAVKAFYNSESPSKKPDLLVGIAERAARKAQVEILDWVFREGFHVASDSLNNEFYHQACFAQSIDVWKALVKNGFDLNGHHSEFVGDALSLEAYNGNVEIVRFLLENGEDPNQAWAYCDLYPGVCALTGKNPSLEIIRLLLQHGWRQRESGTHIAAAEIGNLEALQLLVENGADLEEVEAWWSNPGVNEKDREGTALYRAALKGQGSSVEYLLNVGAKHDFKDKKGRSILWAAKQGEDEKVNELLKRAGLEE